MKKSKKSKTKGIDVLAKIMQGKPKEIYKPGDTKIIVINRMSHIT